MVTVSLHGQYEITSVRSDTYLLWSKIIGQTMPVTNTADYEYPFWSFFKCSSFDWGLKWVRYQTFFSFFIQSFFFYSQATFAYRSDPGRNLATVNWLLTECNNLRGHLLGFPSGIWTIPNTIVFEVINRGQY